MRLMWNCGYTSDVLSVAQTAPQTITIVEKSTDSGKEFTRKFRTHRLVAAYYPKQRTA